MKDNTYIKWGYCNDKINCPNSDTALEDLKKGKCQTYKQEPCLFPFNYEGKMYDYCLKGAGQNKHKFWCATSFHKGSNKVMKTFDYCTDKCPMDKSCTRPNDISNGVCNEENNYPSCGYDGGDCDKISAPGGDAVGEQKLTLGRVQGLLCRFGSGSGIKIFGDVSLGFWGFRGF